MILSKLDAARIAYAANRAYNNDAGGASGTATWEHAFSLHGTWLDRVTAYQQKGTTPAIAGDIVDDTAQAIFVQVLGVICPRLVPGIPAGRTFTFAVSPTSYSHAAAGTQQITESGAVDKNGDTVTGEHYTYSSSSPTHATVSGSGLITAVATGSAVITVRASSGATKTIAVTVS